MELRYWWLSAIALLVVAAVFVIAVRRGKKRKLPKARPVAHSKRLLRLPEYQAVIHKTHALVIAALGIAVVAVVAGILLMGRLSTVMTQAPEMRNRDIMLCLDTSGSMSQVDAQLVSTFSELVKKFDGERIGLTIFDSSAVTVFPLTTDYTFVSHTLAEASKAFENKDSEVDMLSGTNEGEGSSTIGDGLASCVSRFGKSETKRSRSVIFATDNYVNGKQNITLPQAAALAKARQIRVYGINPDDYSEGLPDVYTTQEAKEFRAAVLLAGGDYYRLTDPTAVGKIVEKITAQEAARFSGTPQIMVNDSPAVLMFVMFVATVGLLAFGWRLKQ